MKSHLVAFEPDVGCRNLAEVRGYRDRELVTPFEKKHTRYVVDLVLDQPVTVAVTEEGSTRVVGFITRESLEGLGLADHVAVYLPQSYNFAGQLLLVPRSRVQPIEAASSEVMKFLVSGGVAALQPEPTEP